MIDLLDLGDEIGEVGLERSWIMVVEDVEVDAVSSASKESGSVAFSVEVKRSAYVASEKRKRKSSPVEILPHDPQHQWPRADDLQVAPRHLKY